MTSNLVKYSCKFKAEAGLALLSTLLAGIQFHIIQQSFGSHYEYHIITAERIVDGAPHWLVHQSRILGPYMVEILQWLTNWDFGTCYETVTFLLLVTFFFSLMLVTRQIFNSGLAVLGIAASAGFLNSFLMQGEWLYIWDYIHLTIFTLLIWAILTNRPLWTICTIMIIEIFNHDLVLVLAGWLLLDSIFRLQTQGWKLPKIIYSPKLRQSFLAIAIGVCGYFVMDAIRHALVVTEPSNTQAFALMEQWGVKFYRFGDLASALPFNLELMKDSFLFNSQATIWAERLETSNLMIFNPIILGIPVISIIAIFSNNYTISRIGILHLILWGALFTTSPIYETRIWLPLVPFICLIIPILYSYRFHPETLLLKPNEH